MTEQTENKEEAERASAAIAKVQIDLGMQTANTLAKIIEPYIRLAYDRGHARGYEEAFLKGQKRG